MNRPLFNSTLLNRFFRASHVSLLSFALSSGVLSGCASSSGTPSSLLVDGSGGSASGGASTAGDPDAVKTLASAYSEYFPIGVAIGAEHLADPEVMSIVTREFNHLTAENDMKAQAIQPSEGNFTFDAADAVAQVARDGGMMMTGHTLLWHRQAPAWFFSDLTPGDSASIETLKTRLQQHIAAVVPRYNDVVDNWDVVNEAISDDPGKDFRDASEGSQWYASFGNEEYVYWAFKYAYDSLEAIAPGNAKGKLYYNDYNVNLKIDRIIPLLDAVRARGVPVDGIGMQAHVRMDWPTISELRATIEKITAAGYAVKISELDMTVYADYDSTGAFVPQPEVPFTPALESQQAAAYGDLFALFREHKDSITSVTLWGVSDDQTWLDDEPVAGRDNYPMLFNDERMPKEAYNAVVNF